jgi:hypothetical protein
MATSMKQEWINYVYESDPADPVSFARMCARSAIKAGELDDAVRWKEVIIAIQDELNKEVMQPLVDNGPDDDSCPVF